MVDDKTSADDGFVGRDSQVTTLTQWLRRSESSGGPRLRIGAISGPGGIGKSFLVRHVETTTGVVDHERYLKLELRGTGGLRSTARLITTDLPQSLDPTIDLGKKFPRTSKLRSVLTRIDEIARGYLEKNESEFGKWIPILFNVGVGAAGLFQQTRALANVLGEIDERQVERFAKLLEQAFRSESGPMALLPPARHRNKVRANVQGHLAQALAGDLRELINGDKYRRLLLLLDDYESLEPVLGSFLLDDLLPVLRDEAYETTIVVVGRDRLRDTGAKAAASWKQHYQSNLLGDIELKHLTNEESTSLIRARLGADVDEALVQRIAADTEGYPYLIDSEVEDTLSGGGTAISLRNFVARTTRWMTAEQCEWMQAVCFLDVVNEDSIAEVLPEVSPSAVLDWFERESSIRSPHTKRYAALPIIRSRVMAYVENRSPKKYQRLVDAAARARSAERAG